MPAFRHRSTSRADGDFVDVSRFEPGTTWLRQVHGATVVEVDAPGAMAGAEGDAAVTRVPGARLAVRTADCVPVVLHADGVVAVVHAGWRGLAAGVIEAAIESMGAPPDAAILGPHIRRGCYEFGAADLDDVAAALGPHVRSATSWGTPSLDLTAGVRHLLAGIEVTDFGACTACSDVYFSHRARQEAARFATIAWLEP